MRVVFVGAGDRSVATARLLIERDHEVVIVEKDREKIEELREDLDCAFLHGDGSKPGILAEADPGGTDVLFALTDSDQYNIISGLIARSQGFRRVITAIGDEDFEPICRELGLEGTVFPTRTISNYLADSAEGVDILELSTIVRGDARFYTFTAGADEEGEAESLDLPEEARLICIFRKEKFILPDEGLRIRKGDSVVVLTHRRHVEELEERYGSGDGEEENGG